MMHHDEISRADVRLCGEFTGCSLIYASVVRVCAHFKIMHIKLNDKLFDTLVKAVWNKQTNNGYILWNIHEFCHLIN